MQTPIQPTPLANHRQRERQTPRRPVRERPQEQKPGISHCSLRSGHYAPARVLRGGLASRALYPPYGISGRDSCDPGGPRQGCVSSNPKTATADALRKSRHARHTHHAAPSQTTRRTKAGATALLAQAGVPAPRIAWTEKSGWIVAFSSAMGVQYRYAGKLAERLLSRKKE